MYLLMRTRPFDWANKVYELGHKLGKSNEEMRDAFLGGFPEAFDHQTRSINDTIDNYMFPPNYAAHFGRLAGTPHPHAGEPDINEIAKALIDEWSSFILHDHLNLIPRDINRDAPSLRFDPYHSADSINHRRSRTRRTRR